MFARNCAPKYFPCTSLGDPPPFRPLHLNVLPSHQGGPIGPHLPSCNKRYTATLKLFAQIAATRPASPSRRRWSRKCPRCAPAPPPVEASGQPLRAVGHNGGKDEGVSCEPVIDLLIGANNQHTQTHSHTHTHACAHTDGLKHSTNFGRADEVDRPLAVLVRNRRVGARVHQRPHRTLLLAPHRPVERYTRQGRTGRKRGGGKGVRTTRVSERGSNAEGVGEWQRGGRGRDSNQSNKPTGVADPVLSVDIHTGRNQGGNYIVVFSLVAFFFGGG